MENAPHVLCLAFSVSPSDTVLESVRCSGPSANTAQVLYVINTFSQLIGTSEVCKAGGLFLPYRWQHRGSKTVQCIVQSLVQSEWGSGLRIQRSTLTCDHAREAFIKTKPTGAG